MSGVELKRTGQQLALDFAGDEWRHRVVEAFAAWAAVRKLRGLRECAIEEFRAEAAEKPESHRAWGALPRLLMAKGLIEPVLDAEGQPRYRPALSPQTHAHPVRVWRLL